MVAMGRVPWCGFTMLPVEYCATAGDCVPEPVILHDSASRGVRKIGRWERRLGRFASAFLKGIRATYTHSAGRG